MKNKKEDTWQKVKSETKKRLRYPMKIDAERKEQHRVDSPSYMD